MKTIIYLSVVVLLLTTSGCSKEDDINQLPPATQTGENIFGCKINGEVYKTSIAWKYSMITLSEGVRSGYKNRVMYYISGEFVNPRIGKAYFTFNYDGGLGIYRAIEDVKENSDSYINITRFDNDVVSGTFNIVKYAPEFFGGDSITTYYTEGRFDIKRNN